MLNGTLSNKLWGLLEGRADDGPLFAFSSEVRDGGIRVETFTLWKKLKNGRRIKSRIHHRIVRDKTGNVLYDQLEDVSSLFIDDMVNTQSLVPDIRTSPNKARKLLGEVLDLQREIDSRIEAARSGN